MSALLPKMSQLISREALPSPVNKDNVNSLEHAMLQNRNYPN